MTVQPIHTGLIPIAEQSLFRLLDRHLPALEERTVLAITSKLVAISQGLFFRCDTTDKQTLIESEADAFLPPAELTALRIKPEDDLYAPLLHPVNWKRAAKTSPVNNHQAESERALAEVPSRGR